MLLSLYRCPKSAEFDWNFLARLNEPIFARYASKEIVFPVKYLYQLLVCQQPVIPVFKYVWCLLASNLFGAVSLVLVSLFLTKKFNLFTI